MYLIMTVSVKRFSRSY